MSEGPLSPEEVAHRGFGVSFRGFDTAEVRVYLQRVANELRASTARERDLHRRLADAEHRAANPVIEGELLTRAMGEEMARILASAQQAANSLKERAEENTARMLREAHEQAQRIRAQAEAILAVRTDEANAEAADIRRAAQGEAEALIDRARTEAAEAIDEMQERARQMVHDAQATRARVLGELARRRRLLQTQVEQLRAGRDRLLDAYRLVRSTTDDVADELQRVEDEARRAAGAAGERMAAEPVPDEDPDVMATFTLTEPPGVAAGGGEAEAAGEGVPAPAPTELVAVDTAAEIAAVLADHVADEAGAAAELAEPAAPEDAERRPERVVTRPGERRSLRLLRRPKDAGPGREPGEPGQAAPGGSGPAEPGPAGAEPAPGPSPAGEPAALGEPRADVVAGEAPAPDQPAGEAVAGGAPSSGEAPPRHALPPTDSGAGGGSSGEAPAPDQPPADAVAGEPAASLGEPAVASPAGAGVEELFARIRAGRAEAVAKALEVLSGDAEEAPAAEGADGGPAAIDLRTTAAVEPDPAGEESLLRRRDAAVEGIEPKVARRLKRALQDEQNEVLDRLRSSRAGAGATDVLPSPGDQAARYAQAATDLLAEAATAGVAFVAAAAGARQEPPPVDEIAAELAASLAEPLRRALERAFDSDSTDPSLVFERIGAAYRECKAQRIEGLAGDAVTAAFGRGALSALPAGAEARWVVDDDGRPCPDCDDNALAGPTAAGEPFPTGQPHPPAHAGCRCLLAPVQLAAAVPDAG